MFPTSIRAFSRSRVAMSASAPSGKGAVVQWFTYFVGISAFIAGGAAILFKFNETNSIKILMDKKRLSDEAHRNKEVVQAAKPEADSE